MISIPGPCSGGLGPCLGPAHGAHVPLPMSQGSQGLLRPPCGHVFSQESMEIISDSGLFSKILNCSAKK